MLARGGHRWRGRRRSSTTPGWTASSRRGGDDAGRPPPPPGRKQVIPAFRVGGPAHLRVAVPGADEAVVQTRVLTPDRAAADPAGRGRARGRAARSRDLDLSGIPAGRDAIQVRADLPVVAAAMIERRGLPGAQSDFGWSTSTAPVASWPAAGATRALRRAHARGHGWSRPAEVTIVDAAGTVTRRAVPIPADSTASLTITGPAQAWVTPVSGTVRAGLAVADYDTRARKGLGPLFSVFGLPCTGDDDPGARAPRRLTRGHTRQTRATRQSSGPRSGSTSPGRTPSRPATCSTTTSWTTAPARARRWPGPPPAGGRPRCAPPIPAGGEEPAEWHLPLPRRRVARRHVLDRELDGARPRPVPPRAVSALQDQVVEPLGASRHCRHRRPGQRPPAAAAVAVPPRRRAAARALLEVPSSRQPTADGATTSVRRALGVVGLPRLQSTARGWHDSRECTQVRACASAAVATLTYVYSDQTAVLGPLATYAEPHTYDLCAEHAERLTAPRGLGGRPPRWRLHRSGAQPRRPARARRRRARGRPARRPAPRPAVAPPRQGLGPTAGRSGPAQPTCGCCADLRSGHTCACSRDLGLSRTRFRRGPAD